MKIGFAQLNEKGVGSIINCSKMKYGAVFPAYFFTKFAVFTRYRKDRYSCEAEFCGLCRAFFFCPTEFFRLLDSYPAASQKISQRLDPTAGHMINSFIIYLQKIPLDTTFFPT